MPRTELVGYLLTSGARVENTASLKILRGVGLEHVGEEEDLDGVVSVFANHAFAPGR